MYYAHPVYIAWEATDTAIFTLLPETERPSIAEETATATTGTAAMPGATVTVFRTSQATSNPPAGEDEGLSIGAKAGIGVGALGVIVLGIVTAFLLLRRRRRSKTESSADTAPVAGNLEPGVQGYYNAPAEVQELKGSVPGATNAVSGVQGYQHSTPAVYELNGSESAAGGTVHTGRPAELPELRTPQL